MNDGNLNPLQDEFQAFLREGQLGPDADHLVPLTLALYRMLGAGAPATPAMLTKALGEPLEQIHGLIAQMPASSLEYDGDGAIVAFGGLSTVPANLSLAVDGVELFTWCIFDALFLPQILGKPGRATTRCPVTKETIEIDLEPDRIVAAEPEETVMSIVAPGRAACRDNLRGAFCNHVNLFVDLPAFRDWARTRAAVGHVSIEQAHELGRQRNFYRYGGHL